MNLFTSTQTERHCQYLLMQSKSQSSTSSETYTQKLINIQVCLYVHYQKHLISWTAKFLQVSYCNIVRYNLIMYLYVMKIVHEVQNKYSSKIIENAEQCRKGLE